MCVSCVCSVNGSLPFTYNTYYCVTYIKHTKESLCCSLGLCTYTLCPDSTCVHFSWVTAIPSPRYPQLYNFSNNLPPLQLHCLYRTSNAIGTMCPGPTSHHLTLPTTSQNFFPSHKHSQQSLLNYPNIPDNSKPTRRQDIELKI